MSEQKEVRYTEGQTLFVLTNNMPSVVSLGHEVAISEVKFQSYDNPNGGVWVTRSGGFVRYVHPTKFTIFTDLGRAQTELFGRATEFRRKLMDEYYIKLENIDSVISTLQKVIIES